jgi:hypothetical protein
MPSSDAYVTLGSWCKSRQMANVNLNKFRETFCLLLSFKMCASDMFMFSPESLMRIDGFCFCFLFPVNLQNCA